MGADPGQQVAQPQQVIYVDEHGRQVGQPQPQQMMYAAPQQAVYADPGQQMIYLHDPGTDGHCAYIGRIKEEGEEEQSIVLEEEEAEGLLLSCPTGPLASSCCTIATPIARALAGRGSAKSPRVQPAKSSLLHVTMYLWWHRPACPSRSSRGCISFFH